MTTPAYKSIISSETVASEDSAVSVTFYELSEEANESLKLTTADELMAAVHEAELAIRDDLIEQVRCVDALLRLSEGARIWNAWTAVMMLFVVEINTKEGWQ